MVSRKLDQRSHIANRGFTLIEVMIVLAIIAILAAVAYPSYQDQIRTARRSDAMDALLTLQNLQEKWRANNTTYGTLGDIGGSVNSVDGRYTVAVTGNTATAYILTVTAVGDQANDYSCAGGNNMTLTISAGNPRGVKAPATCWRN
ncbi:MAG: type IV pilin protein [Gammaproteobacteria bacterium]|nr:type IV pilin protein [Gammaproteobacteria bacterium]